MDPLRITFVISQLDEEQIRLLNDGYVIVSKMILSPDDYRLFHYREGDKIQVESQSGNRTWCAIQHLEIVEDPERTILIFTLVRAQDPKA